MFLSMHVIEENREGETENKNRKLAPRYVAYVSLHCTFRVFIFENTQNFDVNVNTPVLLPFREYLHYYIKGNIIVVSQCLCLH